MQDTEARLDSLVRQVRDLPTLPDLAVKVMRITDDAKASAADVARVLTADQAMTARVLKLANSAFYGIPRRISTVTDAVVLLGMRTVRNMTFALGCQPLLERALPGYALRPGDLWRHSFCCAFAAQSLAKRARYRVAEEAFVGGLLHDIGKVILNTHLQAEFAAVFQYASENDIPFMDAERAILGFDHAEAGSRVLAKWNLPQPLVDCVHYHHEPLNQPAPSPLTALVHLADVMCLLLGIGLGGDGLQYPLQEGALDLLELTPTDFEQTTNDVCEALSHSEMLF